MRRPQRQGASSLDPTTKAALIAATVTLLGIFLRDLLFALLKERRERKETALSIYRTYADPLISSATSLLWRLNEVFNVRGRSTYLRQPSTEFEQYKKISTVYRLASLIGWIRAYQREVSFLEPYGRRRLAALENAIRSLEAALADGPHIEIERVKGLAKAWDLRLPDESGKCDELGVLLNNVIKPKLHAEGVSLASELSDPAKEELCAQCAQVICKALGTSPILSDQVAESREEAVRSMDIREAWIYRDWQSGIGDVMIHQVTYGGRAFEVIGFAEFESLYLDSTREHAGWLDRLKRMFDDLDVDGDRRVDARIAQLEKTMFASAQLVVAMASIEKRHNVRLKDTLSLARELLRQSETQLPT